MSQSPPAERLRDAELDGVDTEALAPALYGAKVVLLNEPDRVRCHARMASYRRSTWNTLSAPSGSE